MGGGLTFSILGFAMFQQIFSGYSEEVLHLLKDVHEREIKAIYLTAYTAGNSKRRQELLQLIERSELNAVVIDVKDSTGRVFFKTHVELAENVGSENLKASHDLGEFVKTLKKNNIYTIARIAVFQDPYLVEKVPRIAVKKKNGEIWRDRKGLAWVDPAAPEVWKYNIDIARSAMLAGFDELNFDYIRFPTDGNLEDIVYPVFDEKTQKKTETIKQFFYYVDKNFKNFPVYISVDLFGITLWRSDGVDIGQRYQDAANYTDYISPMVYPSHYPEGFQGYGNPAEYPYEIVYKSLDKARTFLQGKRARLRPWLQDFDLGADYDSEKLHAQMKAAKDGGGFGWMFWNASNRYTEEAFE